ncbi:MAG: hypothetical protein IJH38_01015 [Clostridia bacterium]|nr:hypothetical protein [Clostridia bacterium]
MGVTSKYHRYREAGEQANVNNVARFGQPHHSLFTTSKVFTLHRHIDITDEREKVVYEANTQFFTIHDKTWITDAGGNQVAYIWRKVFTLHERRFVEMANGTKFELSNELFHLIRDITNIEGLGWQLRGNIAALNFELYDRDGSIIALISQKALSLHDKYCIDIYRPELEGEIVAILVALQHMIRDRENASWASSSGDSASASGN